MFGLYNLPFVLTKLMDKICSSIRRVFMDFFLDDIIIYSATVEEYIEQIFIRLQLVKWTVMPEKTSFV